MAVPPQYGPRTPIDRLVKPFLDFARFEASSGLLLVVCTLVAMIWANSDGAATYFALWEKHLTVGIDGAFELSKTLHHWINDGLMALFFFQVGLEIKRELLAGELASRSKAALPVAAALGGMVVPAAIYAAFNVGKVGAHGWGIPMATDIAFSLGILSLLGRRVPLSLKIFLTALAIVDDLGAVLVIAFFYTSQIAWTPLGLAFAAWIVLWVFGRLGGRSPVVFGLLGFALWLAMLKSGVHATLAGVMVAIAVPGGPENDPPLERWAHALHPWVSFVIMPIFALANAGLSLKSGLGTALMDPVAIGIVLGLFVGKPLGIFTFSWLAVRLTGAEMPGRVRWSQLLAVSVLAGIGFTMSIFVGSLAFDDARLIEVGKAGILAGSLLSALVGLGLLAYSTRNQAQPG